MGWLQVETGVSRSWTVQVSADGSALATYTSTPSQTVAVDQLDDLLAWLNGAARAWFGNVAFGYRIDRTTYGKAVPTVYTIGGVELFDFQPDAAATAMMGWATLALGTETVSVGIAGGWNPAMGVHLRGWLRQLDGGPAAAAGALRPGDPGSAACWSKIEALPTSSEVGSLQAILRAATQPRSGWVLHDLSAEWMPVSIGPLSQERLEDHRYRTLLDARGA